MSDGGSVRPARLADEERLDELERRLGVRLGDRSAALAALTHASFLNEHRSLVRDDNERLEFLGDAVVDLVISHRLMERLPQAREGELSKLRAALVDEEALATIARELDLGSLLLLGRGEELSGGREKPSLLADALEAVIGAVYLSGGLPLALELADRLFRTSLERALAGAVAPDAKTHLQETAQSRLKLSPRYRIVSEQGPDHAKTFVVEVAVGDEVLGRGSGRSKKDAEQAAAREALSALRERLPSAPTRPPR